MESVGAGLLVIYEGNWSRIGCLHWVVHSLGGLEFVGYGVLLEFLVYCIDRVRVMHRLSLLDFLMNEV